MLNRSLRALARPLGCARHAANTHGLHYLGGSGSSGIVSVAGNSTWRFPGRAVAAVAAAAAASSPVVLYCKEKEQPDVINLEDWAKGQCAGMEHEEIIWQSVVSRQSRKSGKQLIMQTCQGAGGIRSAKLWRITLPAASPGDAADPDVAAGRTRLVGYFDLGDEISGHPGLIHGGFTAALIDELCGWVSYFESKQQDPQGKFADKVFTAKLQIDYKRPMKEDRTYAMEVVVDKVVKGRKVYLKAYVRDQAMRTCAEGTCLYILK
mmetsp:Transcript_7009/g.15097  ORF Transcript_7009/g.15097 Transcript_7009/m.15097 type:complete len:264 (-) Transcript_7009:135-926(-)